MPDATCPHCLTAIVPAPRRSRLCPHCRSPIVVRRGILLTEVQAKAFDSETEAIALGKRKARAAERYRESRASTARELRQAKESRGVVSGIRAMVSANDCRVCQAVVGVVFPIESCTLDMLPPYRDCELEDGCRASISCVLEPEWSGRSQARRRATPRSWGLAGCLMVASILIGVLVVVLVCFNILTGR